MNTQIKRSLILILLASGLIVISFGGGFIFGKSQVICEICPPQDLDFSLFWEAYHRLREEFVEPERIQEEDIIYGAISGMVESLDDPYSVFFDPEDTEKFLEDITGRFEGVGMEIGIRDRNLQVIAPLEGTPAQKAGLMPGDQILKFDGELTVELSLDEAVSLIRGPKGTKVTLTIFREGWDMPEDIEVERAVIEVPSLKWELIEDNIAYIKIYHFSEKASFDFTRVAIQILGSGAQKIILDLRNNPGGYLEVARDIAGFFLKRGEIVVIEDSGEEREEYKARGNAIFLDYPIVVLINEGSASGSEILAGALRDNRGIILIGEDSFGKGSVQRLEKLRGGSSLKITTAEWLTPKGQSITDVGLEADIKVEMTEEDYKEGRDPQLDKAIETLKNL